MEIKTKAFKTKNNTSTQPLRLLPKAYKEMCSNKMQTMMELALTPSGTNGPGKCLKEEERKSIIALPVLSFSISLTHSCSSSILFHIILITPNFYL